MKSRGGIIRKMVKAGTIILSVICLPMSADYVNAAEVAVRDTIESTPSTGNLLIGVEGKDATSDQKELLDRINEVRYEACTDGKTPDPNDSSRMLQPSDYVPMKLGMNCTKAAMIRSAEAAVYLSHIRPNQKSCTSVFDFYYPNAGFRGENLAWDYISGSSIEMWIDERDAYLGLESGQTGHYESLINPRFQYTGLATFNPINDNVSYNWSCTAGEYADRDEELESFSGEKNETVIQKIEIPASNVTRMDISGDAILSVGKESRMELMVTTTFDTGLVPNTVVDCPVYDGVTWSSSDPDILSVDENGKGTAKKQGTVEITARIGESNYTQKVSREFIVVPEGVTVTGVQDPEMITVESTKKPVLAKTVDAVLSNGATVKINAEWDAYDENLLTTYFKSKEFEVNGMAGGYPVTQKIHVNAAKVTGIYTDPAEVVTDSGMEPSYPKAFVSMSNGLTYYDLSVDWDSESLAYYKRIEGGTFEIKGVTSYRFPTDEGNIQFPVSATLVVNPAAVTNVSFDESVITVPSGTEPIYPKASVFWSNGDITEEEIIWNETDDFKNAYKKRDGGTYTITGTYGGNTTSVRINVNPASIESVNYDDNRIQVENGVQPELSAQAQVIWSNGDSTEEMIDWETIPEIFYNNMTGGTFDIHGQVVGKDVKVTCVVAAPYLTEIQQFDPIETVEGVSPSLPATARIVWNNGQTTTESILWNVISEEDYLTPKTTFEVYGSLEGRDDTENAVNISVNVREKQVVNCFITPPEKLSYLSGQTVDYNGCRIEIEYDNLTSDRINVFDDGVELILLDEKEQPVNTEKISAGKYFLKVKYFGEIIASKDENPIVIEVKSPSENAEVKIAGDTKPIFSIDASEDEIKQGLSGMTITVPCEDGTGEELVITTDMMEVVEDVAESDLPEDYDNSVSYKRIKLKVGESVQDAIESYDSEEIDGDIVYAYLIISVEKQIQENLPEDNKEELDSDPTSEEKREDASVGKTVSDQNRKETDRAEENLLPKSTTEQNLKELENNEKSTETERNGQGSTEKNETVSNVTTSTKLKTTAIKKTQSKKKAFTIKWKKISKGITGYQIQYSTDKKFKKNTKKITIAKAKTTSKTIKKLKSKKKYYVRIRTYQKVGKTKNYSKWSKVKTVKTK